MKNFESRINQLEKIIRETDKNQFFIFDFTRKPPVLSYKKETVELELVDKDMVNDAYLNEILDSKGLLNKGQKKFILSVREL